MITKYIHGSILDTELGCIGHGVNCQNKMGSGVAKALFTKYPEIKKEYHEFCEMNKDSKLLGRAQFVMTSDGKIVYNMFTQDKYGYDGKKYVNYAAVVEIFTKLAKSSITRIAIPKIGCGLAGGNWTFMEQLINDTVGDDLEIWVYELETKRSGQNDLG
jgi:O-acetyl-ADP-ribose deacetylase (regulator of RNase III)